MYNSNTNWSAHSRSPIIKSLIFSNLSHSTVRICGHWIFSRGEISNNSALYTCRNFRRWKRPRRRINLHIDSPRLTQIRRDERASWNRRVVGRVRHRKLSSSSIVAGQIFGRRGLESRWIRKAFGQYREYRCRGYIATVQARHNCRRAVYDQTARVRPVRTIRVSATEKEEEKKRDYYHHHE